MVKWSLVTVAYNSASDLSVFWSGFQQYASDVEWIVVDNSSSDGSAAVAESLGAKVIRLESNRGFGGANNIGFSECAGSYIAFVNPDVTVDVSDLDALASHLDEFPNRLVSPQLVNPDGSVQPNGRGAPYLAYKILNRIRPSVVQDRYLLTAEGSEVVGCQWLMGAVVAGRREHLAQLGPWDTRYFVYYEDSDLGLRNERSGGDSAVLGSIRWVHGWARETTKASLSAWKREIPSMFKFYCRYPRLLGIPLKRDVRAKSRRGFGREGCL